ncbi:MAG TPA: M50 family metallopeptidase [Opitutaceae bacterium]|nr:M50 family metallopeptidase [Opitutaceae bacterium]
MLPSTANSLKLFRLFGIQVYLHWSWFLVAAYEISTRRYSYSSLGWNALEYIGLFVIVLMHEFGHALATQQVGGKAHRIVLWPFGGVAVGSAPPRAGAQLWVVAAGPLVNVVLIPVFLGLRYLGIRQGWYVDYPDVRALLQSLMLINLILLIFNLLPIYPLDGGQILRSLLWFPLGQGRSLTAAAWVGFAGLGLFVLFIAYSAFSKAGSAYGLIWQLLIAFMLFQNCVGALRSGRALRQLEKMPRHARFVCPTCKASPPAGPIYACARCQHGFDPFTTNGVCPNCSNTVNLIPCFNCGQVHTLAEWSGGDSVRV